MNPSKLKVFQIALIVFLSTFLSVHAGAQNSDLTYSLSFTDQELDDLLAPIALYPDPLLAQMLPASTYPSEIADANEWLRSSGRQSDIDNQNWDESIKAIARYPDVLKMMADNMDWTANLGDAFLNQPEDVTTSIQRLRWQAKDTGNLVSNEKQDVVIEEGSIEIVPAQPQFIYVPVYDSMVVYTQRPVLGDAPFILFGPPFILGAWLIMDFNWGHHEVIYHGWNRPGWVNHARPYVHVTNVYVHNSRPFLHERWRHDASHGDPARYLASRPSGPHTDRYARTGEVRGKTVIQPRPAGGVFGPRGDVRSFSSRGRESRGTVNQQPITPVPSISRRPAIQSPGSSNRGIIPTPQVGQRPAVPSPSVSERRALQTPSAQRPSIPTPPRSADVSRLTRENVQPAGRPSPAFGGYRGADEAKALSLRGQASRQNSTGGVRTPSAPIKHESAPAGKDAHGDKQRR